MSSAGAGPYAFVDKVRADDAGNYYVSDSEAGTITKTLPSRARQPYAVTGFNGPQTGLAIDQRGPAAQLRQIARQLRAGVSAQRRNDSQHH